MIKNGERARTKYVLSPMVRGPPPTLWPWPVKIPVGGMEFDRIGGVSTGAISGPPFIIISDSGSSSPIMSAIGKSSPTSAVDGALESRCDDTTRITQSSAPAAMASRKCNRRSCRRVSTGASRWTTMAIQSHGPATSQQTLRTGASHARAFHSKVCKRALLVCTLQAGEGETARGSLMFSLGRCSLRKLCQWDCNSFHDSAFTKLCAISIRSGATGL